MVSDPQQGQGFAGAQRHPYDGHQAALAHRVAQQGVRTRGGRVADAEVVGLVLQHRVDPVRGHEGQDLDGFGGARQRQIGEVLLRENNYPPVVGLPPRRYFVGISIPSRSQ
nr:hypothetical protein [Streptomyces sp. ISL-98]